MRMRLPNKLILSVCAVLFWLVPATSTAQEIIDRFEADITPYEDGSFLVEETIAYDFGSFFRHGIFRDLSTSHQQQATSWYKDRRNEIEVLDVRQDGEAVPYEVTETADATNIKIGDPDIEITGEHEYEIDYLVRGGLSYYEDHTTELYWNITGHEWPVPIRQAIARVSTETGLVSSDRFCYAGPIGSTNSCQVTATTTHVTFLARNLGPGAGLTVAQELNPDVVAKQIVEDAPVWFYWFFGGSAWLVLVGWFVYRYKTEHKPLATVISQYEPYQDFKPMFTGVLIDGHLDSKDITAGLVYLAEQGFIKIKKTEAKVMLFFEVDDYEVELLRSISEVETNFLRDVLLLLFEEYDAVGMTVKLSKLKSDTGKRKENAKLVKQLREAVMDDLTQRGYFERLVSFSTIIVGIVVLLFLVPFLLPYLVALYSSVVFPIVVIIVGTLVVLGFAYQRRTRKGYEALNHLEGFKEFLSVTDKERFKFHNAPSKSPEQFMRFLPYAIALGVEAEWSEVFKDIQIEQPNWYEGQGSFSAVNLSRDIGAFSTAFASASSNPSSSGSGGGGFSGGGSGGGGGGSW